MVECSIKDPKWVDMIESLFQNNNLLTFTVQTKNDFKKLSDALHKGLHLSEINIRTVTYGLNEFRPPVARDELQRYGLEGWATDFIAGPEPVLAGLCGELRIQSTALGWRDTTPQQYDMLRNSPIENWVTSKSSYRIIRRREYGPGATSAQVRDVRKATVWTDQPVDIGAKRTLQENIEGWESEVHSFQKQNQDLQTKLLHMRDQIRDKESESVRQCGSFSKRIIRLTSRHRN